MTTVATERPIRVLLVEDNPGDARLILEALRESEEGLFRLDQVDRLERALELLARTEVDVLLLDLWLPDSAGLETFNRARRSGRGEPIVVISGHDDETIALDAVRSGAQDYVVKSRIDSQLLPRVIQYAIERKRIEQSLRASEDKFSRAFRANPCAMWISSLRDGRWIEVNDTFLRLSGFNRVEVIARVPEDFSLWEDPHELDGLVFDIQSGLAVRNRQVRLRTKTGQPIQGLMSVEPIELNGQPHLLFLFLDLTERLRTEEALADTGARLKSLVDNSNDGIAMLATDGTFLEINHSMSEILGRVGGEVLGRKFADFFPGDVAAKQRDAFSLALAIGSGRGLEVKLSRPDGSIRIMDCSITVADVGPKRLAFTIGRDVTAQRSLEHQLAQSQKMEAVGRLASGVAHDFNNVLTAIFGHADLVSEELPKTQRIYTDIVEIKKAAKRAAGLTGQLLAFSRQQVLEPVVLNVRALLEDLDRMLRRLISEDLELQLSLPLNLGNVRADPGQLEQVIVNLVLNARDALPLGGRIAIGASNVEITAQQHSDLLPPPGRYVLLTVADNGTGMDQRTMARVFEPFFTTKEKGKGTGLGLSTAYGIVKQHGGEITVASELGRGTTFSIYLPQVNQAVEPMPSVAEADDLRAQEEATILVTEDDELLLPLMKNLLTRKGYQVIPASTPEEALALARDYQGRIDLLISDMIMPGMSGPQLAEHLAKTRPETRVLYMSGHLGDAMTKHGVPLDSAHFLAKPFTPIALATKVREALSTPAGHS